MARQTAAQAQKRLLELAQERGVVLALMEAAENGIVLLRLWQVLLSSPLRTRGSVRMEYARESFQQVQREIEAELLAQMAVWQAAVERELRELNER